MTELRLPGAVLQGILARAALVFLRFYLGMIFLVAGIPKIQEDFATRLAEFLRSVALTHSYVFYQEFAQRELLPHVRLFAGFVTWAEVLVGAALVLGFGTRVASAVAVVLLLNYMLAKGAWFGSPASNDAALMAIAVALIMGAAGRTLGVDAVLARRWPRSPLW
jgi:uncharacterized membrane protein YphA (DoxX/SURF4 family)